MVQPQEMWQQIETVLLDMDGTLLDKHFDDYFWEQYVPSRYAEMYKLQMDEAHGKLLELYKKKEGTLEWTDLDYWSDQLGLDIPQLKMQVNHLIQVHPYVIDFLKFCRKLRKKTILVTNAHSKTLDIKMRKTAIGQHFDRIICSEEIGVAKEEDEFWRRLQINIEYNKESTLLADDTENVLLAAQRHGIKYIYFIAKPSSVTPSAESKKFTSIRYFKELMYPIQNQP